MPGQKPFMSVEEFLDMLDQADMFDDEFALLHAKQCFVCSMQPVVDEQATTEHHEMTFQEFLGAVRRVAAWRRATLAAHCSSLLWWVQVCRLAWVRVSDSVPLFQKLPLVLEDLFIANGLQREDDAGGDTTSARRKRQRRHGATPTDLSRTNQQASLSAHLPVRGRSSRRLSAAQLPDVVGLFDE